MLASSVPDDVSVFEVDHPSTQAARREALRASPGRDITFVAVDLASERLSKALHAVPSFDANSDTVFVAEGLLMYLERERVEALLEDMAYGPAGRRIILTMVTPDHAGRVRLHSQRRIVDWCMRWLDERFVWGERCEELTSTLERHGYDVASIVSTMDLRDRVLDAGARKRMPRPTGEVVVVAVKSRQKLLEQGGEARLDSVG
jgi:methyltransferase (TIGR00027 family)